jgi:hypothetical protein
MRALLLLIALVLGAPAGLAQQGVREVTVENACNQPIRILVMPAVAPSDWRRYGWFTLQPGSGPSTLTTQGWRVSHMPGMNFYYYAEATRSRIIWEGREHFTQFEGVRYGLRRGDLTMQGGRLALRLTCG